MNQALSLAIGIAIGVAVGIYVDNMFVGTGVGIVAAIALGYRGGSKKD